MNFERPTHHNRVIRWQPCFLILVLIIFSFSNLVLYVMLLRDKADETTYDQMMSNFHLRFRKKESYNTLYKNDAKVVPHQYVNVGSIKQEQENNERSITLEENESIWSRPIIHIINTRFMQHQSNLTSLAAARLVLFETFCLPSILNQKLTQMYEREIYNMTIKTNINHELEPIDPYFLWIIKVDPELDQTTLQRMVEILNPYPNFYLIGSLTNYWSEETPGGWRGGQAGDDILKAFEAKKVYSGSLSLVQRAHKLRNEKIILETRLDADDGLHHDYLSTIQEKAMVSLSSTALEPSEYGVKTKWLYWCALHNIDWDPNPAFSDDPSKFSPHGVLLGIKTNYMCITPGLTNGVSVGVLEEDIGRYPHHLLLGKARNDECGFTVKRHCVQFITDPSNSAIRARTTTSAGMKDLYLMEGKAPRGAQLLKDEESTWNELSNFNITKKTLVETENYMSFHSLDVALDNLKGQCTPGHSCKDSSKKQLDIIVKYLANKNSTRMEELVRSGYIIGNNY